MKANKEQLSAKFNIAKKVQKAQLVGFHKSGSGAGVGPSNEAIEANVRRGVRSGKEERSGFAFHEPDRPKKDNRLGRESQLVGFRSVQAESTGKHGYAFHEPSLRTSDQNIPSVGTRQAKKTAKKARLQ